MWAKNAINGSVVKRKLNLDIKNPKTLVKRKLNFRSKKF